MLWLRLQLCGPRRLITWGFGAIFQIWGLGPLWRSRAPALFFLGAVGRPLGGLFGAAIKIALSLYFYIGRLVLLVLFAIVFSMPAQ